MSSTKLKNRKATPLSGFAKPFLDTVAHWSALRSLGFSADEIFFGYGEVSGAAHQLYLELHTQGKVFIAITGAVLDERECVFRTWEDLAQVINRTPVDQMNELYRAHLLGSSLEYFAMFAAAIRDKGIVIPQLASGFSQGDA